MKAWLKERASSCRPHTSRVVNAFYTNDICKRLKATPIPIKAGVNRSVAEAAFPVTAAVAEPIVGLGTGTPFKPFSPNATSESAANPTAGGL